MYRFLQDTCRGRMFAVAALGCLLATITRAAEVDKPSDDQVQRKAGTVATKGIAVYLGCEALLYRLPVQARGARLVQGLDTDADEVSRARDAISRAKLCGPVTAQRFAGKQLPYTDNLVNLIVARNSFDVPVAEMMRVLAPGGSLRLWRDGKWKKMVKPRPQGMDEWTHYLHDASGNPVAHDEFVGPPGRLQWIAAPRHTRSHEYIPSIYSVVSSGGRIFYIEDQSSIADIRLPSRWFLVARDAFNGIKLWQRPLETWFPHLINWGQTPRQLQRKLVAIGDRVFVTLGLHSPLVSIDAATGETEKVYDQTRGTEEIVWHNGVLLLVVRDVSDDRIQQLLQWGEMIKKQDPRLSTRETAMPLITRLRNAENKARKFILALDAESGSVLWRRDGPRSARMKAVSICASGERVFFQNGSQVTCLELKTGRELWSVAAGQLRVVTEDRAYCASKQHVTALDAKTGAAIWKQPPMVTNINDVFVAGNALWVGGFKPMEGKRGPSWGPYFATQRDLATGEVLRHIEPENPGHHHRCYQNKATDRYILGGRRGTEFIDLKTGEVLWNSWVRGVCRYGVMPSNGLLYAPPHACACYVAAKTTGFYALARRGNGASLRGERDTMLERGPAFGKPIAASTGQAANDWPTYRRDGQRSGSTRFAVPLPLEVVWRLKGNALPESPTIADGIALVTYPEKHRIVAAAAHGGKQLWEFTAGARIDSPPTITQGRVIFGCQDGYVYCVRAANGTLDWRLRTSPSSKLIACRGQFESATPVVGSVLVKDNVIYATAGRSSYMDGGISLLRIDPASGKVLSQTQVYSPDPETGAQPDQYGPNAMPGTRADILSCDGDYVYLREMVFSPKTTEVKKVEKGHPHLLTLTDFRDGSWAHRSFWIFGTRISISCGCGGRDRKIIAGRLMVFDDGNVYGYGRTRVDWSSQLEDGPYHLFSRSRSGTDGKATWSKPVPITVHAMVQADDVLFLAGMAGDANAATTADGKGKGGLLMAFSASDGKELARYPLSGVPIFDGMAAAYGRLYITLENGDFICLGNPPN